MSKTILLADDSVTIRKVIELTLMDEDVDLISVENGDEALRRFSEVEPDLVIADVHMPGANGYEVGARVKSSSPETPVLLLVGTFETYDEDRAREAEVDEHLKKPFDSQELLHCVHRLLALSKGAVAPKETADEAPAIGAPAQAVASDPEVVPAGVGSTPKVDQAVAAMASHRETGAPLELSDETVDRIARRVVELLSEEAIREVAWEVIPDLAEVVIKERLNELESQVE